VKGGLPKDILSSEDYTPIYDIFKKKFERKKILGFFFGAF